MRYCSVGSRPINSAYILHISRLLELYLRMIFKIQDSIRIFGDVSHLNSPSHQLLLFLSWLCNFRKEPPKRTYSTSGQWSICYQIRKWTAIKLIEISSFLFWKLEMYMTWNPVRLQILTIAGILCAQPLPSPSMTPENWQWPLSICPFSELLWIGLETTLGRCLL